MGACLEYNPSVVNLRRQPDRRCSFWFVRNPNFSRKFALNGTRAASQGITKRSVTMATIPQVRLPIGQLLDRSHVAVIIPPSNAGKCWKAFSKGLNLQGLPASQVLIVDSSSDDGTRDLAAAEGYQVHCINRSDFNHGGTRQLALDLVPWASIVVYLTQDAALATHDSLDLLLSAFEDRQVAAAYGRQLPRPCAGPIEAHARLFNYPPQSDVRDFESRHRSEEHTSELQSLRHLVCRLLLEKKKRQLNFVERSLGASPPFQSSPLLLSG